MKSWKKPTDEMIEKVLASVKKETDRQYFFSRLKNPLWIQPLAERGYFQSPPGIRHLPDGYMQLSVWPELQYLKNMSDHAPDEVIKIVLRLPEVDNPRVYDDILDIALRLHGEQSAKLKPKMLEYASIEYQLFADRYADLLAHWTTENLPQAALELSETLVKFESDSQSKNKQARQKKNPDDWTTWLEPSPRFGHREYQEILEKGVRPLAEKEPFKVACILIDAAADMIRLHKYQDELDKGKDEDASEMWWPRLDEQHSDYQDAKTALIHTLTFACEKVGETSPGSITHLDEVLRKQRWKVFKRLRQHLYALHPNEQTKPWIRELILAHGDYARWKYPYEFQRMIRIACEHFGTELLTEEERTRIFNAIHSGPSKTHYRELMGDQFTEELFRQRQRHFHRMQFKPFVSVLFGEHATYFQELEVETNDQISDNDYSVIRAQSGYVTQNSPRSREELANLPDEELLTYINEWQEEHHDKDDWLVEINIAALAETFQTVFSQSIIPDAGRLRFWIDNRERIERPIYVRAMVDEMKERVKAKNFDKLNEWLMFCEWVLSHPDQEPEEGARFSDESREHPHWHSSRRAVDDFVSDCLSENVDAQVAREPLAKLLEMLCTQFDWRLDRNKPILLNQNDQITEAINNTRSRALGSLIGYGFWLRRHDPAANIAVVTTILEKRFAPETEYPLSLPEHAILGRHYGRIFSLDEAWATEHKSDFFPQDEFPAWLEAFKGFVCSNHPFKRIFDILHDDFDYALKHLADFKEQKQPSEDVINHLGHHLFMYYLWDGYPLRGDKSLLERYYHETDGDRTRWASLFDYVGESLSSSGEHLANALKDKCIQFFDWRFEVGEATELQKFSFWLTAKCLEPEWRLEAYSRILDVSQAKGLRISSDLRALCEMLADHTAMVVECFAKLTDRLKNDAIFFKTDNARTILKAGLESNDKSVRQNAERARENLLRDGRFEFLDMQD